MDQITDLRELLKHELKDLYSAETQIIDGLPKMIETARNPQLKKALSDHLKVTRDQKKRLEKIQEILNVVNDTKEENGGFFANLFKSKEGEQHCKAMEGLIKEGESLMKEDMEANVMDAAIIAAAQKIEHYEIGSYGTARAYAEQMGMKEVESLLRQTLDEEYFADDSLTKIAIEKVNIVAESAGGTTAAIDANDNSRSNGSQTSGYSDGSKGKRGGKNKKSVSSNAPSKSTSSAVKNSAPGKSAAKKSSTTAPKKAAAKKAAPKKSAAKKSAPKKSAATKAAPKKSGAKKVGAKKLPTKKSASGRAVKKAAPKKSAIKKAAPKKSTSTKSTGNRQAPRKSAAKKTAPKKSATRNTGKKSAPKKSTAKKSATKKTTRRR